MAKEKSDTDAERQAIDEADAQHAEKLQAEKEEHPAVIEARLWREAAAKHNDEVRAAHILRNKEAENLQIGPDHPLHPSKATNPSNITSPATHNPVLGIHIPLGEGEP
jgi:hypothetical protein